MEMESSPGFSTFTMKMLNSLMIYQVRIHKLRPDTAENFIFAIFNEAQFSSIENHADVGILKVISLIATCIPPSYFT